MLMAFSLLGQSVKFLISHSSGLAEQDLLIRERDQIQRGHLKVI